MFHSSNTKITISWTNSMQIGWIESVCGNVIRCGATLQMPRNDQYSRLHSNMCIQIRAITFSIPTRRHVRLIFYLRIIFALSFPKWSFFITANSALVTRNNRQTISLSAQHWYLNLAASIFRAKLMCSHRSLCRFTRLIWFEVFFLLGSNYF